MKHACTLLWLVASLGCAAPERGAGETAPSTSADAPPATTTTTATFVEREAEPPEPVDAELPDCPADPGADSYCTEAGKLAGQWMMVDLLRIPADAELLFEAEHPDHGDQPSLRVAVQGETLYLRMVSCGACRRVMGQGFAGDPARLSAEQRRALQTTAGLPEDVATLDGIAAWRAWVGGEAGRAALTERSTHGR